MGEPSSEKSFLGVDRRLLPVAVFCFRVDEGREEGRINWGIQVELVDLDHSSSGIPLDQILQCFFLKARHRESPQWSVVVLSDLCSSYL